MTMPILPGLAEEPVSPSLTDYLDELTPETIAELVAEAAAAAVGDSADPDAAEGGTDSEDAPEGDVEGADGEAEEELSDEEVETRASELGEAGDFDAITSWSESALEEASTIRDSLAELHKQAEVDEESGADPDAIEELLERADELVERATEADSEASDAAKAEDPKACAEAALRVERAVRALRAMMEEAKAFADVTTTTEAGFADEPAVKLWAERTMPKAGF